MSIDLENGYEELLSHRGHEVVVVTYGPENENVAIECEDCATVLLDFDRPTVNTS